MATLSEILKGKIGKDGLSKTYVASKMEVTEKTIENYMNGVRAPRHGELLKLAKIVGFDLSEMSEHNVRQEELSTNVSASRSLKSAHVTLQDHIDLLASNDRFFKTEYAKLMLNLGRLFDQSKNLESLVKLNLQHTGAVEAAQKGIAPAEIQEQINNEIANAALSQKDSVASTLRTQPGDDA